MGLFSDGAKSDSQAIREIVEAARKRLKADPADAGAVLKLADALAGNGQRTEAVRLLNRYGPIVQSKGRLEEAIAIYKKASQLDPDCDLTSSTYLSHLQLRKILEAEKAAQTVAPPARGPCRGRSSWRSRTTSARTSSFERQGTENRSARPRSSRRCPATRP